MADISHSLTTQEKAIKEHRWTERNGFMRSSEHSWRFSGFIDGPIFRLAEKDTKVLLPLE